MHLHCGTDNRAPRWTFMDPCKPEVRPGAREESMSPAWLVATAMNARDTTKVYMDNGGMTLDVDQHYIGSVTTTTHQEKGIITLDSNPSRGTVLPAPHGKGNKCDKNVKKQKNWCNVTVAPTIEHHGGYSWTPANTKTSTRSNMRHMTVLSVTSVQSVRYANEAFIYITFILCILWTSEE